MAKYILLNDQYSDLDKGWYYKDGSFVVNDSTSNFILGQGQKRNLSIPPFISTQCLKDNIDYMQSDIKDDTKGCYSKVNKGYIQYYIDPSFTNPFNQIFEKDDDALTFKYVTPDNYNTIEYTRQPLIPIPYYGRTMFYPQWFVDTQNHRKDILALKMRTIVRQDYTPAKLF